MSSALPTITPPSRDARTRPTMRESLAMVWRTLRSMRTALVLLLLLGLGAIAGSLVPQFANSPERVMSIFRDHPLRAAIYNDLQLFDVFGSWWFTLIYTLLLISLAACLFPRTRALFRNVRSRPAATREMDGLRHYAERTVPGRPDRVIDRARGVLRRKMFRVERTNGAGGPGLAADKGLAREAGSLLFHWSFFLILLGIVYGKGTGFTGFAVIAEGQCWVEAHSNYDGQIHEGRFFGGDHTGVRVCVRDFTVAYQPNGQPREFLTEATFAQPDGTPAGSFGIQVNHPAEIDGVKYFQYRYGWAPVVEVRLNGRLIASGPITFAPSTPPEGLSEQQLPWHATLELASLRPQVGLELELWPDGRAFAALARDPTATPPPMLLAVKPLLFYRAWQGDLNADAVRVSPGLDKTGLTPVGQGVVGRGESRDLPGAVSGLTISFPQLRQYTVLEVSRDRGLWIELLAAILILLGLLPALYTSKRKLWVKAEPAGEAGTVLKVGGFALQRKTQFEEEFDRLVDELARSPLKAPRRDGVRAP